MILFDFKMILRLIIIVALLMLLFSIFSIFNQTILKLLSYTCHQIKSRSLTFFGESLGICSRCFGIYFGILILGFYLLYRKIKNKYFILLLFSSIVIVYLKIQNTELNNLVRFCSGIILGFTFIYIIDYMSIFIFRQLNKILHSIENYVMLN